MNVKASGQARGPCCTGLCQSYTQLVPLLLLRLTEKGSKGWMRRREGKLKVLAPKFCARGYKAAREKLVSRVGRPSWKALASSLLNRRVHVPKVPRLPMIRLSAAQTGRALCMCQPKGWLSPAPGLECCIRGLCQ